MKKRLHAIGLFALLALALVSCDRNTTIIEDEDDLPIPEAEDLLKDSTYYYSLMFSLWNESFPQPRTNDDVKAFTTAYSSAEEVLENLKSRTPKIGPNGNPVDIFSFIDRQGQVGEEIGQGLHRDLGLSLLAAWTDQNRTEVGIYIRLVQKNSPAEQIGLKRGMRILSVDGVRLAISANAQGQLTGNVDDANKLYSGNVNTVVANAAGSNAETSFSFPTTNASYTIDPILKKIVLSDNNKRVGYLAYTSFVSVRANNRNTRYYDDLLNTFKEFESANITDLIVDLRYNGGGATNAAELLTDLIVPPGNDGQIMYKYEVNDVLEEAGWIDENNDDAPFKPVRIQKPNTLNINKVYFLVTSASASASELVINSLKPYMNVEIISTNNEGTYGKPVGSFGWSVVNGMADLYITSIHLLNKNGEGGYFNGLRGSITDAVDNWTVELGDPSENMLATALNMISGGNRNSPAKTARSSRTEQWPAAPIKASIGNELNGMYELDIDINTFKRPN